jgi:hypothetical protein
LSVSQTYRTNLIEKKYGHRLKSGRREESQISITGNSETGERKCSSISKAEQLSIRRHVQEVEEIWVQNEHLIDSTTEQLVINRFRKEREG